MKEKSEAEDYWERQEREDAKIPPMPRDEYLRKYPNGGPERWSGNPNSETYREFRAAIKRRDIEGRRGGWTKFWWSLAFLAVVFTVVLITQGLPHALITVLILAQCWCFIQMMMNLPSR